MAVTTGYVGSAAITWSASTTATVTSQSIGTAAWDRIVLVAVSVEDNVDLNSCTIGGVTANVAAQARDTGGTPDNTVRFFWLPVATGTTADIVVTASASISQTGRISVWAVTGAYPAISDSNTNTGSGTTLTLTGVTINPNGAGFWAFNNATTGTAVTWTNATERDDTSVGNYRHSVADSTTAGTATITADGATANQAIVGVSFDDAIPVYGWDRTPQYEKAVYTSARAIALASMAAGLVLAPMPPPAAAPQFNSFDVTTDFVARRTVNYQDLFHVQRPIPPDPVQVAGGTTTSATGARTLFYQAEIAPPPQPPAAADNNQTIDKWQVRWPDRMPSALRFAEPDLIYVSPPAVTPTLAWMQPFARAVAELPARVSDITYVSPPAAAPSLSWLQPFGRAVPEVPPRLSDVVYVSPPAAPSNLTATLEWMQPFGRAVPEVPARLSDVTYVSSPAAVSNLTTSLEWLQAWRGPPQYKPIYVQWPPFIPREAVLDNTVSLDQYLFRWQAAVPPTRPIHTQPLLGYPYSSIYNLTTTLEWLPQWRGAPRVLLALPGGQPFVPKEATRENTQTPDKWLQAWRGPPKYQPVTSQWLPFVAREAVLDNTVSIDQYLFRWQGAVPPTRPEHTQPSLTSQAPAAPTLEWMQAWKGPHRIRPAKPQVTFQVLPISVATNLTTSLEWMDAWKGPPRIRPAKSQVTFLAQPISVATNLTTTLEWMRGFDRAVRIPRPINTQPISALRPIDAPPQLAQAAVATWRGGARTLHYQANIAPLRPIAVQPNLTTTLEWQQPLSTAVPRRPVRHTQPRPADYPYTQPVCVPAFQITAFQFFAFQTCATVNVYQQEVNAGLTFTADLHVCGWSGEVQTSDAFLVQGEASDTFVEQAEATDAYDEQEECGR